MSKYKRPDDLPGRVCRVLQGMTGLEGNDMDDLVQRFWVLRGLSGPGVNDQDLDGMVYRFTHIASGLCGNPHEDWMAEFEKKEAEIEESFYTSPAEREKRAVMDVLKDRDTLTPGGPNGME